MGVDAALLTAVADAFPALVCSLPCVDGDELPLQPTRARLRKAAKAAERRRALNEEPIGKLTEKPTEKPTLVRTAEILDPDA